MSKICPNCAAELEDAAAVCDKCGKDIAEEAEAPVTELLDEPAEEAAAEAEDIAEGSVSEAVEETAIETAEETPIETVDEDAEESAEADTQEAPAETTVSPINFGVPRPTPEIGVPEQAKPQKKSNKDLALGIGIVACIVLLIAAIVTLAIVFIPKIAPKNETQKALDAYLDSDYETYFSHEYYTMFKGKNLDEMVEQMEAYKDMLGDSMDGTSAKVLDVVSLPNEAIESIKSHLDEQEYDDVDKIEDIKMVIVQVTTKAQTSGEEDGEGSEEAHDEVSVSALYAVKVGSDWYFSSGF